MHTTWEKEIRWAWTSFMYTQRINFFFLFFLLPFRSPYSCTATLLQFSNFAWASLLHPKITCVCVCICVYSVKLLKFTPGKKFTSHIFRLPLLTLNFLIEKLSKFLYAIKSKTFYWSSTWLKCNCKCENIRCNFPSLMFIITLIFCRMEEKKRTTISRKIELKSCHSNNNNLTNLCFALIAFETFLFFFSLLYSPLFWIDSDNSQKLLNRWRKFVILLFFFFDWINVNYSV